MVENIHNFLQVSGKIFPNILIKQILKNYVLKSNQPLLNSLVHKKSIEGIDLFIIFPQILG